MANKEKTTDLGILKINNEVIASIAKQAALEVDGVKGLKTNPLSILSDFFNKGYNNKGITLDITDRDIKIGVTIIVKYGVSIPDVASLVQENIRTAIEEMTGLSVAEVDVDIGDLYAEKREN
ncbi:MAG: Asp23/Gls24 family envelope stress response protein [PVC group bacterium]|nr:Asp23/Gls24 family envelope stress response protein [PVC group bacterium]